MINKEINYLIKNQLNLIISVREKIAYKNVWRENLKNLHSVSPDNISEKKF